MKNKGISLITLVITIVVVIILAAAVILSLGNNNPIQTSRVATLMQTKDALQSGILVYLGNVQSKTLGEYTAEQILIQNEEYRIVEDDAIENNIFGFENEIWGKSGDDLEWLYKLDIEKVKLLLNIDIKNDDKFSWYINKSGNPYLVYESVLDVPEYYKENGSLLNSISNFITTKKGVVISDAFITNSYQSSMELGIKFYHKRRIPEDKIITEAGVLVVSDGSLDINSTVSEANTILNINNTLSNVEVKTNTSTDRYYTFSKGIIDNGFGIWARGYVKLNDGTVIYSDSLYSSLANINIKSEKVDNNLKFNISRDVGISASLNSEDKEITVVEGGVLFIKDDENITETSSVSDVNNVLTVDSTNSNVIKRTNTSTDRNYTFSEEIEDSGNGVWARGYVIITCNGATKTMYTNSIYDKN